jgi:hypothetical protein
MVLPSRKVLSLLVLTIALVASIIIVFGKEKSGQAINFANNLVAGEKFNIPENESWQTEVSQVAKPINVPELAAEEQTVTDTVSTTILSNYLALKQNNTLTQESAQNLIDQTINFIGYDNGKLKKEADLNIIADNGLTTITEYGENLGNILKKNKPAVIKNEIEVITKALESSNQSKIEELKTIANVYNNIANDLLKMKVPKTFVRAHLDLINGSNGMGLALYNMQQVFQDPIKSLPAFQAYNFNASIFKNSLKATNTFIMQNKVVYKQGAGGYYLLYGL